MPSYFDHSLPSTPGIRPTADFESAMSLTPMLGQLMQIRREQQQIRNSDLLYDRERFEFDNLREDRDEYETFRDAARSSYVSGDDVGNAQRREDLASRYVGNPLAMSALEQQQRIGGYSLQAKKDASDERDIDFNEENRKTRENLLLAEQGRAVKLQKLYDSQAEDMLQADSDKRVDTISSMNASIYERDPETSENLTMTLSRMWRNKDDDGVRTVGKIASAYNKSLLLESAYAPEIAAANDLKMRVKRFGVDLDAVVDKDSEAKTLVRLRVALEKDFPTKGVDEEVAKKNAETQRRYVDSFGKAAKVQSLINERKGLGAAIAAHFSKVPERGSPEEGEWQDKLAVLEMRARNHGGIVSNRLSQMDSFLKKKEQMLDLQKKTVDIIRVEQQNRNDVDKLALQRRIVSLREQGMQDDMIRDTMKIALMTDEKKRRTPEQIRTILDESFDLAIELRGKAAGEGTDLFPTVD